jgi:hypothetical protein
MSDTITDVCSRQLTAKLVDPCLFSTKEIARMLLIYVQTHLELDVRYTVNMGRH